MEQKIITIIYDDKINIITISLFFVNIRINTFVFIFLLSVESINGYCIHSYQYKMLSSRGAITTSVAMIECTSGQNMSGGCVFLLSEL